MLVICAIFQICVRFKWAVRCDMQVWATCMYRVWCNQPMVPLLACDCWFRLSRFGVCVVSDASKQWYHCLLAIVGSVCLVLASVLCLMQARAGTASCLRLSGPPVSFWSLCFVWCLLVIVGSVCLMLVSVFCLTQASNGTTACLRLLDMFVSFWC